MTLNITTTLTLFFFKHGIWLDENRPFPTGRKHDDDVTINFRNALNQYMTISIKACNLYSDLDSAIYSHRLYTFRKHINVYTHAILLFCQSSHSSDIENFRTFALFIWKTYSKQLMVQRNIIVPTIELNINRWNYRLSINLLDIFTYLVLLRMNL